ncbi:MAG: 1,4-dihydroxy-2-naphthoate polyprenyltransferase [Myxococcota bacterium]
MSAWIQACRPATLTVAAAPVVVGSAVAHVLGQFAMGPALGALFGALAIQVGTNLANDVFDFKKGADTAERLGPTRAVQAGWLSPQAVTTGMIVAFGLAVVAGLYLAAVAGWPIVVVGIVSILAGIGYTAGPAPLAYIGAADVFVMVFFGQVAVAGTTFVQTLTWEPLALMVSVPIGALATAVLVVNNLRDRNQDVKANKRTLVVRLGATFGQWEYRFLVALAYIVPVALAVSSTTRPWILLPLLSLPLAVVQVWQVATRDGRALNANLAGTARLLLVFSALLAVGLLV